MIYLRINFLLMTFLDYVTVSHRWYFIYPCTYFFWLVYFYTSTLWQSIWYGYNKFSANKQRTYWKYQMYRACCRKKSGFEMLFRVFVCYSVKPYYKSTNTLIHIIYILLFDSISYKLQVIVAFYKLLFILKFKHLKLI